MYDPKVGRWLTEDPIGFDAGDANVYRYVGNSPTNAVDPSGLFSWSLPPGTSVDQGNDGVVTLRPSTRPGGLPVTITVRPGSVIIYWPNGTVTIHPPSRPFPPTAPGSPVVVKPDATMWIFPPGTPRPWQNQRPGDSVGEVGGQGYTIVPHEKPPQPKPGSDGKPAEVIPPPKPILPETMIPPPPAPVIIGGPTPLPPPPLPKK